jgi:hypothetical protein
MANEGMYSESEITRALWDQAAVSITTATGAYAENAVGLTPGIYWVISTTAMLWRQAATGVDVSAAPNYWPADLPVMIKVTAAATNGFFRVQSIGSAGTVYIMKTNAG